MTALDERERGLAEPELPGQSVIAAGASCLGPATKVLRSGRCSSIKKAWCGDARRSVGNRGTETRSSAGRCCSQLRGYRLDDLAKKTARSSRSRCAAFDAEPSALRRGGGSVGARFAARQSARNDDGVATEMDGAVSPTPQPPSRMGGWCRWRVRPRSQGWSWSAGCRHLPRVLFIRRSSVGSRRGLTLPMLGLGVLIAGALFGLVWPQGAGIVKESAPRRFPRVWAVSSQFSGCSSRLRPFCLSLRRMRPCGPRLRAC